MQKFIRLIIALLLVSAQQKAFTQWTVLNSGTTQTLKGIDMLDAARGVAVGEGGVVLRTQDGGDSWQPIGNNLTGNLRSAVMINYDHIIVSHGDIFYGGVFRTLDGGMHWDSVAHGADLINTGVGLYSLSHEGVAISTNQGGSWTPTDIVIGGTTLPDRLRFSNDHTGYVCGNLSGFAGYFNYGYRSEDAGQTWQELFTFDFPTGDAYTAACYTNTDTGFYFLNQNVGFLPGPTNKLIKIYGFYYDNTPGYEAWRFDSELTNDQMPAYINDGFFSNNQKGVAAGNDGNLYATDDGGLSWQVAYQGTQPLWGITSLYNTPAFVVGQGGLILRNNTITSTPVEPQALSLKLFPNPAQDFIQLQWPADLPGAAQLQCFDATGKMLMQTLLHEGDAIDIRQLSPGVYWAKLTNSDARVWRSRFVVQD